MKRNNLGITVLCGVLILLTSCKPLTEFNASLNSYYMPDIDVFVVRTQGFHTRFIAPGGDIPGYLTKSLTGSGPESVNYYLKQVGVSLHHSRIRVFYIKANTSDLRQLANYKQFTLTDYSGNADKGTVYNEPGPLKVFLAGHAGNGTAGRGYVGRIGLIILSKPFSSSAGYSNTAFSKILAHELGHNFRLLHTFDDDACDPASIGQSSHVMNYSGSTSVFAPCERMIVSLFVKELFKERRPYHPDRPPNIEMYLGDKDGQKTIGTASYELPQSTEEFETIQCILPEP